MNDPALQEPFDYSILDEKTREIILRKTDETRGLMRRTTENIITIGENLLTVQKHLPEMKFSAWLRTEFDLSRQSAYNFMKVASKFGGSCKTVLQLPARVLYELASSSDAIVEQVEAGQLPPTLDAIKVAKESERQAREAERQACAEAQARQGMIEQLTRDLEGLRQHLAEMPVPEVEIREVEMHVVPPETIAQLETLQQKIVTLTQQRDTLSEQVSELQEEVRAGASERLEGEHQRRIRLNWYRITSEFQRSVRSILSQWPSPLDALAFEADDWTRLSQTRELARRFLESLLAEGSEPPPLLSLPLEASRILLDVPRRRFGDRSVSTGEDRTILRAFHVFMLTSVVTLATAITGGYMTLTSGIHSASLLARICGHQPLLTTTGEELLRRVSMQRWDEQQGERVSSTAAIISVDNGNDAFKGAMLHAQDSHLRTKRIVTAYVPARTIRAGEGVTTWQVNDSEAFQIGIDALFAPHTESLPIGGTPERLADLRLRHFLCACLVELLIEAGYCFQNDAFQGEHDFYVSFGIPNEELDLRGIREATRQALRSLLHVTRTVRRTDEQGRVTIWVLRLVEVIPYPQSFASYAAWYYTPDGTPIETDIKRHVTLDIGGGQLYECAVTLLHQLAERPKLRMPASLLGDGTIVMARAAREALRVRYPGIHLSDAEAQQMLVSGAVTIEGRRTDIRVLTSQVVAACSRNLFTQMLPLLQEGQTFHMFTGGGPILLAEHLYELVRTKRRPQSFLFVPREFASVLNAIGGYVLAQAIAQREQGRSAMPRSHTRQYDA